MGRWNRRYLPRNKYRHYDYEDPPLSPPRHYGTSSGGVPSWEIDYCKSARVPWHKILASKKYIYSYPSVLDWDSSAGEEALNDAKKRYWAMINNLPCDNPLPDPDIYIDEIDWNPYMDPELMAELDLPVFDPDKAQNDEKLETINEEVDKNQPTSNNNPWESNNVQSANAVNGWGTWGESVNMKDENPWEQNCSQVVDAVKDNAWKSGNESWGNECGNSWDYDNKNVDVRQEGWGNGENNSWNWNGGNVGNCGYSGDNYYSQERGWRENKNQSWGWKEAEYQSNHEPRNWDSRSFRRGGRSFRGDCRKREGSIQHTSKFKSSKYHADTYGNNHQW